jgi:hypothetical protein
VAGLTQVALKPLLNAIPQVATSPDQNNIVRLGVGALSYAVVLADSAAQSPLTYAHAWSLLPTAGTIAAGAIAAYHILSDAAPARPDQAAAAGGADPDPAPAAPALRIVSPVSAAHDDGKAA